MNLTTDINVFNNAERIVEGWYWAMRSVEVKRGRTKALSFFGREMVVYRGEDNAVVALDAYCPHMGRIWPKAKWKATTSAACFITGSTTQKAAA